MKPHIKFKDGQWQMSGWADRDGWPMIAVCRDNLAEALAYFRKVVLCP